MLIVFPVPVCMRERVVAVATSWPTRRNATRPPPARSRSHLSVTTYWELAVLLFVSQSHQC